MKLNIIIVLITAVIFSSCSTESNSPLIVGQEYYLHVRGEAEATKKTIVELKGNWYRTESNTFVWYHIDDLQSIIDYDLIPKEIKEKNDEQGH